MPLATFPANATNINGAILSQILTSGDSNFSADVVLTHDTIVPITIGSLTADTDGFGTLFMNSAVTTANFNVTNIGTATNRLNVVNFGNTNGPLNVTGDIHS